jgi:chaperonin GroEL (HSP60 family)
MLTNIIDKETLRNIQLETLKILKESLMKSFGPYGSNTIIYEGNEALPRYTKDGHTILKNIKFNGPVESSVHTDIEEETRTQAVKVGDSTTSITILSALIFEKLAEYEKTNNIPPADLVKAFKFVVNEIKETIKLRGKDATIEDMYNISMISTNGDEELSKQLKVIYEEYGLDVYVDVKASLTGESYVKEINGMVLDYGFMDTTFVNDPVKNSCELRNPNIYAFEDPIDTIEMGTYLDFIIEDNIMRPMKEKKFDDIVPTVIITPRISKDFSAYLDQLIRVSAQTPASSRLPLNIITNIDGVDTDAYHDICELCGCKYIKKYIDPEIQKQDIKNGLAIDINNRKSLHNMAGSASMVISDNTKTTFIDPINMYNENNEYSEIFKQKLSWLESEIVKLEIEGNDSLDKYKLKKRLNSLKGNMVEIYIGGITIADRDQARDLMEDAALNCRSAVKSGIGCAANFEGYYACKQLIDTDRYKNDKLSEDILGIIHRSYYELMELLYESRFSKEETKDIIINSGILGRPLNLRTKEFDNKVLTSIDTDICVLDTISKIITIMATSNQFLLPTVNVNNY